MNRIKLLSEELINQIAAGEVVERPASALKELLENAIDAGADKISVEIDGAGLDLIRIRDNGCGMSREDLILSLERHATSKIISVTDLENIQTMGFRGEALAAIASISHLTLITRRPEDLGGTKLIAIAGRIEAVEDCAAAIGTTIEIRDLFYNVPARKKFLKSDSTEVENLITTTTNAALAHSQISWKLIIDGKMNLDLAATDSLNVRIRSLFGSSFSDKMLEIFNGAINLGVKGFVGKPEIARSSKTHQYLFVNRRPIKSSVLSYAVKQAFHSLIPKEKNPVFVIFLEIAPNLVDVNVHPRKTEVKFSDEKEVFRTIQQCVSKALEKQIIAPVWNEKTENYYQAAEINPTRQELKGSIAMPKEINYPDRSTMHRSLQPLLKPAEQLGLIELKENSANHSDTLAFADFTILGQHDNSMIIISRGNDLWLIDQHAAHERVRYEELMRESENAEKVIQPLLTPLSLELKPADIAVLDGNKDFFDQMGIEIEHFGGNTFNIHSVPAAMADDDLVAMIEGLIDDLRTHGSKGDYFTRREKILTYFACRSAVKFGDELSLIEIESLLKKWLATNNRFTCPHGRPALLQLTKGELWKRFGRDYAGMQKDLNWAELGC